MAYDDMKKLVDLDMLDRYHKTIIQDNLGGSASVSTIKITTSEASLNGKTVTVTDGVETLTGTFVNGVCTFKKVKLVGVLTVSSSDGETTAQTTIDVQSYGIHTVNLTFKYVLLDISTSEQMLYGQKVTAYLDGIEAGAVTLSGSGVGQIRVEETGKYTLRATASGFKAVTEVTASEYYTTYSVTMSLDYATINVSTSESTLVGQVVRIVNLSGNTVATGVFSDGGTASINTDQYGNFTVSATDGNNTATASIAVSSGATINTTLRFEYSTIHVITTDPLLEGATITVSKEGNVVGTGTFSSGSADILVHSTGTFTVSTEAEGFSASQTTTFSEFFKTNNVTLNLTYATINVSTTEVGLFGRPVTIGSLSKNFSSSGTVSVYTNLTSQQTISSTDSEGNLTTASVTCTMGQTYNVSLSLYHIDITTTENSLEGKTVTFAQGTNSKSVTFVNKTASITFGEAFIGACTLTATDGTDTANSSVIVEKGVYNYSANMNFSVTYSAIIDFTKSDPDLMVEYADDATGMEKSWNAWKTKDIFKDLKTCVVKNGTRLYYLNENNLTQQANGTAADITTWGNDVMVEYPYRIGYSIEWTDSSKTKLKVSVTNQPNSSSFNYDAFSRDAYNDCDTIYIGAYKASENNNMMYSSSGKAPAVNKNIGQFRTLATNRGAGYFQRQYGTYKLWQCLYIISHGTLNSQAAVGRGYVDGNSAATNTGGTNSFGFDSELMSSAQKTEGKTQIKCLGLEDAWGNVWEFIDGLYSDSNRNVMTAKYASQCNDTGSGYDNNGNGGITANVGGWMSKPQGGSKAGFTACEVSGSESTVFCDGANLDADRLAVSGGHWSNGSSAGAFRLGVNPAASSSGSSLGGRLVYMHKEV